MDTYTYSNVTSASNLRISLLMKNHGMTTRRNMERIKTFIPADKYKIQMFL